MQSMDFESIRSILADDSLHLVLAVVQRVVVAPDRSTCRVLVSVLPEQRDLICEMGWDAVGSEAGFYMLPNPNDLVLVGQVEGDKDRPYVIRRLSTDEEKIPVTAIDGSIVMKALPGKRNWITSDTRINLSKGDTQPSENLALGQQLKSVLSQFLDVFNKHTHTGNMGYPTSAPSDISVTTDLKSNHVDNEGILSKISFTD